MKKILLPVFLFVFCTVAHSQKTDLQKVFALLYESSIKPFTGDTLEMQGHWDEKALYVQVNGADRSAELKMWQMDSEQLTLVGLTLTESDMVMQHQQAEFYFYKDGKLEKTEPLPTLYLSSFFDQQYLAQKGITTNESLHAPILCFSPENTISIALQHESFDSTYMGQTELTQLDPYQMAVTKIMMQPNGDGRFEITQRQYRVDVALEVNMQGGWESWCEETCFFIPQGNDRYCFSNEVTHTGEEKVQLIPREEYDSIQVRERFVYAYGKRISETEGLVFYDSVLVKDPKVKWYMYSGYQTVSARWRKTFRLGQKEPSAKNVKAPGISTSIADAAIKKKFPELFDLPKDTPPEIVKNRKLQLYPYAVETEILLYRDGKPLKKTLVFRIRQGEC